MNQITSLLRGNIAGRSQAVAWLMLSVATLGASTIFAILVASSRAPATAQLLPGHDFFHLALILHVTLGPVLWFLAFAMVLWNLALPKAWDGLGWLGFALAAIGAAVLVLVPLGSVMGGAGSAIMSNYVPMLTSPLFLTGLELFAGGFTLSLIRVLRWLRPNNLGADRILGWGLLAAALAGAVALWSVVWGIATLPTDLGATTFYETLFWAPGHIMQSMHVLMMMVAWLILADAAGIKLRSSARMQGVLFLLALLPVLVAPVLHLVYEPQSAEFRDAFTLLMRWVIWPGVALLAADMIYALARQGKNTPRWNAATWALVFSIALLLVGLAIGFSIHENTAVVPAHYHATTGAITLAYLGVALALLPRLGYAAAVARWPVLAYGTGMLLMAVALGWAGFAGMTRKIPGSEKVLEGYSMHLTFVAIGGTLVVLGGIGFVVIMLRSWLRMAALTKWQIVLPLSIAGLLMTVGVVFTLLPGVGVTPVPEKVDPHVDPSGHMQQVQTAEVTVRFQQAVAMLHAKQYEHAVTALQRVLKLEPRLPEAHVNMGFAMLGLKNYAAARSSFETAIELRAMQANAYYGLALAMRNMKDNEGAIGAMRSYLHLSKSDDPYLNSARAFLLEWEKARGHKPGNDLPAVQAKQPK